MKNRIRFDRDTSWDADTGNEKINFRFNIITIFAYIIGIILSITTMSKLINHYPAYKLIVYILSHLNIIPKYTMSKLPTFFAHSSSQTASKMLFVNNILLF